MRIVNDYSFLFKNMPGTAKPKNAAKSKPLNLFNQIKLSDINGKSAQDSLKLQVLIQAVNSIRL